jgi:hypothetical protein
VLSLAFSTHALPAAAISATIAANQYLFSTSGEVTTASNDPAVIRARLATVDFTRLQDATNPGGQLKLNLFTDAVLNARIDRVESNRNGSYTWIGHVEDIAHSYVFLVAHENVLVGKISTPASVYQIRYTGENIHTIMQLDPTRFPDESNPLEVGNSLPDPLSSTMAPLAANDGTLIDVMILYTEAASVAAGGDSVLENEILLAVAEANQTYANSGMTQRIELVHTAKATGYIESGNISTELSRLRVDGDDYIDEAHTLRNTYHADLVSLVVQTGGCGIAYVNSSASTAFSAFSRDCMLTNLTLPHEMAHNMYARHDWYMDAALNSPYSYSKGYVNTANRWRTVMAYNDHCAVLGFNCVRIPYFSNPDVSFTGSPTGVPIGTNTSCTVGNSANPPCDADNRTALNNTAVIMDGFRNSENRWQGVTTAWGNTGNWSLGYVPRIIDDIVIPSGVSNYPIINTDASVREIIIEPGATLTMNGGTLSIYGQWQNNGTFHANGGTVQFKGSFEKAILSGGNAFYNLTIGDGVSTQKVSLNDDLDVNGDLRIETNASLYGGNRTLMIHGNWTDEGTSFIPETSTVIFDGSVQDITKLNTTKTVLSENLSYRDGSGGYFTTTPPNGWVTANESNGTGSPGAMWLFGDSTSAPNSNPYGMGHARRWYDGTATEVDAWLFSPAVFLSSDAVYELSFRYGVSSSLDPQDFEAYIGVSRDSGGMTTQIIAVPGASNTSWVTATQAFQVLTSGTYYLGIRNHDTTVGSSYGGLDNIILVGSEELVFYNLTIRATIAANFANNVKINNNLTIDANNALNINGYDFTVEGVLTNNGTISQSKDVPGGSTTGFLHVTNNAGTTLKYRGVDITPSGTGLGTTTVSIKGNQSSGCTDDPSDALLHRCYIIDPGAAQSATIRFWYTENERNNQAANALKLWHYDGPPGQWSQAGSGYAYSESGTTCVSGGGQACWLQATGVNTYSPFGVGSGGQPNAVKLLTLNTVQRRGASYPSWGLVIAFLGYSVFHKRHRDRRTTTA